jgi:S-adenosylmethionine:tRNA-ribosyltransferase-isomerase (queuine synthetase)
LKSIKKNGVIKVKLEEFDYKLPEELIAQVPIAKEMNQD